MIEYDILISKFKTKEKYVKIFKLSLLFINQHLILKKLAVVLFLLFLTSIIIAIILILLNEIKPICILITTEDLFFCIHYN